MMKFLMWLALAALVIFAIRSKIRQAQKRYQDQFRQQQQAAQPQPQPQPTYKARAAAQAANAAEVMLQCAHCGVFYPASETVQASGRDYCSAAHAALPSA
nr:PP0621 family protein [uncultured Duganella sp.]